MKPSNPQVRRELLFVGGITLLALVPLLYIWRKSLIVPPSPPSFTPMSGSVAPAPVPGVRAAPTSYGEAQISPDGQLFARKESGPVAVIRPGAMPSPNTSSNYSPVTDQLVIRSAKTGKEVFRAIDVGEFSGWTPGSHSFVSQKGGDLNLFTAVSGIGVAPWTQKTLSFSTDARSRVRFSPQEANELELQTGQVVFSPDFRFAVKSSWGYGNVVWQVADLNTGRIYPPVTAGRWLDYAPNVGGFSNNISVTVAPASLGSRGLPVVALLQTTDTGPAPTGTPVPTPAPTPTYSPAQVKFLQRKAKEDTEIQKLVESVLGVDGADPEVTDDAEIARIEKEVKRRNRALFAEEKRYFSANFAPVTRPTRVSQKDYWSIFRLECFDLGNGKPLWSTPVKTDVFMPRMKFSPDGSSLVLWGTAALTKENGEHEFRGNGIDFYAARTGQLIRKTTLTKGDFGILDQEQTAFYDSPPTGQKGKTRSVFVVKDAYEVPRRVTSGKNSYTTYDRNSAFRFFDAPSAREIGHLKFDAQNFPRDDQDFVTFSVSQNGQTWLWGSKDVQIATRRELGQEKAGPLPEVKTQP